MNKFDEIIVKMQVDENWHKENRDEILYLLKAGSMLMDYKNNIVFVTKPNHKKSLGTYRVKNIIRHERLEQVMEGELK